MIGLAGVIIEDKETARALNTLRRHQTIEKLYQDILMDLMICELEGWDRLEYIKMIKEAVDFAVKNSEGSDTYEESERT